MLINSCSFVHYHYNTAAGKALTYKIGTPFSKKKVEYYLVFIKVKSDRTAWKQQDMT
jgi:hypothetical protein